MASSTTTLNVPKVSKVESAKTADGGHRIRKTRATLNENEIP